MRGAIAPILAGAAALAIGAGARGDGDASPSLLTPAEAQPGGGFGDAVAILSDAGHGDGVTRVLVGISRGDGGDERSGRVELWRKMPTAEGGWALEATLTGSFPQYGARFGASIAVNRRTRRFVVGAPMYALQYMDPWRRYMYGAADVYELRGDGTIAGPWPLIPQTRFSYEAFGAAVAISPDGETALVAAPYRAPPVGSDAALYVGAVDIFRRNGLAGTWNWVATMPHNIIDPTTSVGVQKGYGEAVATDGIHHFMSDRRMWTFGLDQWGTGVAIWRSLPDGTPVFETELFPWSQSYPWPWDPWRSGFGRALAVSGGFLAVGAPGAPGLDSPDGTVFLYDTAAPFAKRGRIRNPIPGRCRGFGSSIAFDGETLVIGFAQGVGFLSDGGFARYHFDPSDASVRLVDIVTNEGETAFAASIDATALHVAVGAPAAGKALEGAVHVLTVATSVVACDLDGNGTVDGVDLARVLGRLGAVGCGCPEDLNRDGVVDQTDLIVLLNAWGTDGT